MADTPDDAHAKARANVDNWFNRQSESGAVGHVTIADASGAVRTEIGDGVSATKIPDDLVPHIHRLLKQRDAILDQYKRLTPELVINAELRSHAMQMAIMYLRAKLAKENDNGPTPNPSAAGADAAGTGGSRPAADDKGSGATDAPEQPATDTRTES